MAEDLVGLAYDLVPRFAPSLEGSDRIFVRDTTDHKYPSSCLYRQCASADR